LPWKSVPSFVENRAIGLKLDWCTGILRIQLRKQDHWEDLSPFLEAAEKEELLGKRNKATQLIHRQGHEIAKAKDAGRLSEFEEIKLMESLKEMYDLQGKAERIKNTVFPFYYLYFTKLFLWVFVIMLPCALVEPIGWVAIPVSVIINFVFYILDKSGIITEDPFEGRAADTPMSTLCRTIEIDLREQLGEKNIPETAEISYTKYKAAFYD